MSTPRYDEKIFATDGKTRAITCGELGLLANVALIALTETCPVAGRARWRRIRQTRKDMENLTRQTALARNELVAAGDKYQACYTSETIETPTSATHQAAEALPYVLNRLHTAWVYHHVEDTGTLTERQNRHNLAREIIIEAATLATHCARIPMTPGTLYGDPPAVRATRMIRMMLQAGIGEQKLAQLFNIEPWQMEFMLDLTENGWPYVYAVEAARLSG